MSHSTQQKQLLDLLTNELAEFIELDYSALVQDDNANKVTLLQELELQAANLANAADLAGLVGFAQCCTQSLKNFQQLSVAPDYITGKQAELVENWAVVLLGYLQFFGDPSHEQESLVNLIEFLSDAHWPSPLSVTQKIDLERVFLVDTIQLPDNSPSYPEYVDDDMISLDVGSEIQPELLRGLLQELPHQVGAFERSIEQYLITEEKIQLRIAQRIAHTVKGAANIVGIRGMANLMHYVEDILELSEQYGVPSKLGFVLQDSADCLSSMAEFLAGVGPKPGDVKQVLTDVLALLATILPKEESPYQDEIPIQSDEDDLFELALADHEQKLLSDPDHFGGGLETLGNLTPLIEDVVSFSPRPLPALAGQAIVAAPDLEQNYAPPICVAEPVPQVDPVEAEPAENMLSISEPQAEELLRLTGESQIGNTQILNRLATVGAGIQSAEVYQDQLRQLAVDLERLIESQTALASAAQDVGVSQDEMDPLELERYNELNSFANQLREVATDAHEAIAHLDDDLKLLKNLVEGQRQLGFSAQELLLQIRMLPVQVFTSRFNRCVRQAARMTNKKVRLHIEGEDVFADGRVLTALVDPIMHILRNAVDHGIEDEESRLLKGKGTEGLICLSFIRAGDTVIVSCSDDGGGIDYDAIEKSAKKKGLLPPSFKPEIADLNAIILSPGFSTRSKVSQTSGRGVGLEIVNEQVNSLKGSLHISSDVLMGTTFTITAPMSILSAHTLLVQYGPYQVSILSRALEQVVYLDPVQLVEKNNGLFYRIAGSADVIPILALDELLFLGPVPKPEKYSAIIVIENHSRQRCGVMVESVKASEEQIVKPLTKYTVKTAGVIGASILGDGRVSPVVDLHELPGIHYGAQRDDAWRKRFDDRLKHLQKIQSKPRMVALVVDDSLSARRSLAQFVGDMGLEVYTAKDGFEAIQVIEQKRPNIILADLEMPRMNGLELTSHLRANPTTKDIPIIMITSRVTEKHRSLAAKAGVSSYLNKPWTDEELLNSIKQQMVC